MSEPIITKKCAVCKQNKSVSEFYKRNISPDKLARLCKKCAKIENMNYVHTPNGRRSAYLSHKKYRNGNKQYYARHRLLSAIDRQIRPERYKAKDTIKIMVRKGAMPAASQCTCICGNQAYCYHHYSYELKHRLDVIALCNICHRAVHANRLKVLQL